jgi:ribosomal protein S18 acetylase RimI-like enzyme
MTGRWPAHPGHGHAHHAAQHGMTRLVLDVLPARTGVVSFYRRLGYTETGPFAAESPVPMIYMARAVTNDDILPIPGS